jgi:nucleoside phosphorylase
VAGGARADLLEQRLKAALDGVEGMISIGLGGALDPTLQVGDMVIGSEVLRPRGRWDCDPAWTARLAQRLPTARVAAVYGSNEMVVHTLDKAKLRLKHAAAVVDMESHVAAKLAAARKLPFAVLRVVSDTAGLSLPSAVLAGIRADGGMNPLGVLGALAEEPSQLPALMRVGRESATAFRVLRAAVKMSGTQLGFSL